MAYISFQPSDFFNTVLYTGTGSARDVTGYGFQPDWVWIKQRSGTTYHRLYDSSRGAGLEVYSNATDAESDGSASQMSAFISDGFSIPTSGGNYTNINTGTYAAWGWKAAAGTTSSNSDGSITSTVQANTTAGFSIVTYTGTGANATIGHGLGVAPKMIICKQRNNTVGHDWLVYHEGIGNTKYIPLSSTQAATTASTAWQNTTPTSSVFSVGTSASVNESGKNQLAYCFAEKKGYSKFGSYTGNGSNNGAFIYTGFRPAFVMMKKTSDTGNWNIFDSTRDIDNVAHHDLFANLSNAEETSTSNRDIDFLSNGFKQRVGANQDTNGSGGTYIYMAFAEFPLVGSNGIAGTAR